MLSFLPAIAHPPPSVRAAPQEGEARGEGEDAGAGGLRAWARRPPRSRRTSLPLPPVSGTQALPPAAGHGHGRAPAKRWGRANGRWCRPPPLPNFEGTAKSRAGPLGNRDACSCAGSVLCSSSLLLQRPLKVSPPGKVSCFGSVTPDLTNLPLAASLLVSAEVGAEGAQKRRHPTLRTQESVGADARGLGLLLQN